MDGDWGHKHQSIHLSALARLYSLVFTAKSRRAWGMVGVAALLPRLMLLLACHVYDLRSSPNSTPTPAAQTMHKPGMSNTAPGGNKTTSIILSYIDRCDTYTCTSYYTRRPQSNRDTKLVEVLEMSRKGCTADCCSILSFKVDMTTLYR